VEAAALRRRSAFNSWGLRPGSGLPHFIDAASLFLFALSASKRLRRLM